MSFNFDSFVFSFYVPCYFCNLCNLLTVHYELKTRFLNEINFEDS